MSEGSDKLDAIGSDLPVANKPTAKAFLEESAFALERDRENNRHRLQQDTMRLGAIGKWFGSRDNAIIYIVAILVTLSVVVVAVLSIIDPQIRPSAFEFFKIVSMALVGFFAGRSLPSAED
ncbi:hypothetical protein [Croceicoccus sp. Ery5]|uniref:hypothetical protein n=1 Tax=Croceicoccus sp. Ery5 TaxID=1703340 RepID=UPI001E61782A|nr:hypothetical protein [Croceicoccus sp. Ery5]